MAYKYLENDIFKKSILLLVLNSGDYDMTPEMMQEIWDKEGKLNYMEYFWIDISIFSWKCAQTGLYVGICFGREGGTICTLERAKQKFGSTL